jgi:hypothetical protein
MIAAHRLLPRLSSVAAYAALGPISGPALAGVIRNLRGGAPALAGLYVVAWALVYLELLAFTGHTALRLLG